MNEMTLTQRGLPMSPEDVWAGAQTTALGMPVQQQAQPLRKIHRLLRGRYVLAIVLSCAGAALGAMLGWMSAKPLYRSYALIDVSPRMPNMSVAERTWPQYEKYLRSQVQIIASPRIISAAFKTDEWKAVSNKAPSNEFVSGFYNNLLVELIKDSQLIRVSYEDEDPKVATAAVNAICRAYPPIANESNGEFDVRKLEEARRLLINAQTTFKTSQENIRNVTKDLGTDNLDNVLAKRQEHLQDLEVQVMEARSRLELSQKNPGGAAAQLTPEDIALVDATMRSMLQNLAKLQTDLGNLEIDLGPNNPTVKRLKDRIAVQQGQIDGYFKQIRGKYYDVVPGMGDNAPLAITPKTLETMKNVLASKQREYDEWKASTAKYVAVKQEADKFKLERDGAKEDMDRFQKTVDELEFKGAMGGNITVLGEAIEPITPSTDKRKQMAVMGGMVGFGLPLGILILIGLLDSRYRYSDEAEDSSLSGLTLLGILPNLPDRLSDPGQASIAAHCVHQIRTMLQINDPAGERRAFCVTSASSGDGKTSLTLALGLSFAASGQRTLLIDSDLVGAGLTARLGMTGPEGILEAMTTGRLMDYVKATDVADLSLLPVGMAQLHHAGIFSPQTMRRLVNEAKKHFEIILIDTGPILGSIEATPVAASSDGVILTVSRLQQRPLVEKAGHHLRSIGARIAGVVFNRAMTRDFEQSVSGISMRSAARASQGTNGQSNKYQKEGAGQYGPVAKAVATSVKPESIER